MGSNQTTSDAVKIQHALNEDGTLANVSVGGVAETMTAAHVEALIRDLAQLRSSMNPPVPQNYAGDGQQIMMSMNPIWATTGVAMGSVLLHLRDPGMGWFHNALPPESAEMLSEWLAKHAAEAREQIAQNERNQRAREVEAARTQSTTVVSLLPADSRGRPFDMPNIELPRA